MLAKIRRMYFRDKVPLREIARQTGLYRNTLRHWLRQSEMREPAYPKRTNPSQLDPYEDQLVNWLRTDSQRPKRDRLTTGFSLHTRCARGQVTTLRLYLLKLGAWIESSVRRIVLHLPELLSKVVFPHLIYASTW